MPISMVPGPSPTCQWCRKILHPQVFPRTARKGPPKGRRLKYCGDECAANARYFAERRRKDQPESREVEKVWREAHKDEQTSKKAANREQHRAYDRKWYEANKDYLKRPAQRAKRAQTLRDFRARRREEEASRITSRPIGPAQMNALCGLREHKFWRAECSWMQGSVPRNRYVLGLLVKRSLVVVKKEVGMDTYRLTKEGARVAQRALPGFG